MKRIATGVFRLRLCNEAVALRASFGIVMNCLHFGTRVASPWERGNAFGRKRRPDRLTGRPLW